MPIQHHPMVPNPAEVHEFRCFPKFTPPIQTFQSSVFSNEALHILLAPLVKILSLVLFPMKFYTCLWCPTDPKSQFRTVLQMLLTPWWCPTDPKSQLRTFLQMLLTAWWCPADPKFQFRTFLQMLLITRWCANDLKS